MPLGDILYRFENHFQLGDATASEGFWYYVSSQIDPAVVLTDIQNLAIGWFTEPEPVSGISRADLMPEQARFTANGVVSFALDLLAVESELFQSIFDTAGNRPADALPALVSKEVEIHPDFGGRGRFNRIHTAFHPVDAVEFGDPRRCTDEYQGHLVNSYAFLFDLVNLQRWVAFTHPFLHYEYAHVAYVSSVRGPSNQVLSRDVFPARYLTSANNRWGTMRRRGASVQH